MLQGWGPDMTPVVAADGGRCATKGQFRRYSVRSKGAEVIGIRKVWQEGGVDELG